MAGTTRAAPRATSKKGKRTVAYGQAHVFSPFNNTIVTVTDGQGNTVAWASAGTSGFKGSRKSTPFAARMAAQQAAKVAQEMGMQELDIYINGPGPGREAAIRAIQGAGLRVRSIREVPPVPQNGCRPPKKRRV